MDQYEILDAKAHIMRKDMWAGSKAKILLRTIIFTEGKHLQAEEQKINVSPALCKCIDEPIVNALDHCARNASVKRIDVSIDNGVITIANDGPGIPVIMHTRYNKWIPQIVFGTIFAGSNMSASESSTIGGTNGIGIKLTNIFSNQFSIRTFDSERGLLYEQDWKHFMDECSEPRITKDSLFRGTELKFALDYAQFDTEPAQAVPILYTRVIWAFLYALRVLPHVRIYWNGRMLSYSLDDIMHALFGTRDIFIDRSNPTFTIIASLCAHNTMSLINGICVPSGNHIKYIANAIKDDVYKELAKLRQARTSIRTKFSIIVIWRASNVHWTSQTKDKALFAQDVLKQIVIDDIFKQRIVRAIVEHELDRLGSRHTKVHSLPIDKYTAAKNAGKRNGHKCCLLIAEGDSAMTQLKLGISGSMGFDNYGILSLGGVIPNVRKETTIEVRNGKKIIIRSNKLLKNVFMNNIVAILGLDFTKTYDSEDERALLNYGSVIGCVDQDLDGVGNIFSLVLNFFHLYFPRLLEHGYIKRFATPIKRSYPKARGATKVIEFYTEDDFKEWDAKNKLGNAQYNVRYYKGLGSHNANEVKQMFRNMSAHIITYANDESAANAFEIYLGRNADLRKMQLSKPAPEAQSKLEHALAGNSIIPSSYHFMRDAHAYQLDNLRRKLPDAIGGTNQVGCKIISGCFKIFADSNSEHKVAEIAARISATENYHHGESSLEDAITRRAFIAAGGCQLPFLQPHGQFGSRLAGGSDAASARYIHARLNTQLTQLIYPSDDFPLLQFHYDEGKRGEPYNFVPIIPMAILESSSMPAHGWSINIWAREVMDVIDNVEKLIITNGDVLLHPMRPCCYPTGPIKWEPNTNDWFGNPPERIIMDCTQSSFMWRGYIIERITRSSTETWSIGTYHWISDSVLVIDELPLRVWTNGYITQLRKTAETSDIILKVGDCPLTHSVSIRITINPKYASKFQNDMHASLSDPIILLLGLRERMVDNLNMILPDDSVHSFASYEDVILYWFPIRRNLYASRIARKRAILCLWIEYYENVLRYIDSARSIQTMSDDQLILYLTASQYTSLYMSKLHSPELKYERDVDALVRVPGHYNYILDLRERDLTTTGRIRFADELAKKRASLTKLDNESGGIFIGANMWIAELAMLKQVINQGRATDWQYSNNKYTFE